MDIQREALISEHVFKYAERLFKAAQASFLISFSYFDSWCEMLTLWLLSLRVWCKRGSGVFTFEMY